LSYCIRLLLATIRPSGPDGDHAAGDCVTNPFPEVTMPALSTWNLDPTKLLTRRELATVLDDLARRACDSANSHRNLVVVRLACCCGLRVSEMAALQLDDVVVDVSRPHLRLRRGTTKGGKATWYGAEFTQTLNYTLGPVPDQHDRTG
jgi:integrase